MTWEVGDIRVTPVVESEQAWPTVLFLPDLTPEVVDKIGWLRPDHVTPDDDMIMRFQAFVVEADGARIVVDGPPLGPPDQRRRARRPITGDVLHHAGQVAMPHLSTVADSDAEAARATRRSFLADCAQSGSLMIGTHLPGKTAYRVEAADGDGLRLT